MESDTPGTVKGFTYKKDGSRVVMEDTDGFVADIKEVFDETQEEKPKNELDANEAKEWNCLKPADVFNVLINVEMYMVNNRDHYMTKVSNLGIYVVCSINQWYQEMVFQNYVSCK